jgi:hypothetical protein
MEESTLSPDRSEIARASDSNDRASLYMLVDFVYSSFASLTVNVRLAAIVGAGVGVGLVLTVAVLMVAVVLSIIAMGCEGGGSIVTIILV